MAQSTSMAIDMPMMGPSLLPGRPNDEVSHAFTALRTSFSSKKFTTSWGCFW